MDRLFKLRPLEQAVVQLILLIYAAIVVFPIGVAILNSLKPTLGEVYKAPFGLPSVWSWDNYAEAWFGANLVTPALLNRASMRPVDAAASAILRQSAS